MDRGQDTHLKIYKEKRNCLLSCVCPRCVHADDYDMKNNNNVVSTGCLPTHVFLLAKMDR